MLIPTASYDVVASNIWQALVAGAGHDNSGSFIRRVYAELVSLGRDAELLSLPAGPLEAFLAERGAFSTAQQAGAYTRPFLSST